MKVLFVCLGNICRSPTAEAVFRDRVEKAGLDKLFELDSAGTIAVHAGEAADARMRQHASKRGYQLDSISRGVVAEDFRNFDHIFAMDQQNLRDLQSMAPADATASLSLFLEHDPSTDTLEVPDPYYGGGAGFERVLDLVEEASEALLTKLRSER